MTNEEKAKEIVLKAFEDGFYHFNSISQRKRFEKSLIEMVEWKDEQFKAEKQALMDKAYEWLEPVFKDLCGYYSGAELFDDFKKAMGE